MFKEVTFSIWRAAVSKSQILSTECAIDKVKRLTEVYCAAITNTVGLDLYELKIDKLPTAIRRMSETLRVRVLQPRDFVLRGVGYTEQASGHAGTKYFQLNLQAGKTDKLESPGFSDAEILVAVPLEELSERARGNLVVLLEANNSNAFLHDQPEWGDQFASYEEIILADKGDAIALYTSTPHRLDENRGDRNGILHFRFGKLQSRTQRIC